MSTFQQNQLSHSSPILLSPSSATITNHISLFDNSDQGSVDSDYTSLGSSKFYGNSGSTSSLNRQGRSQSIDELASTTSIPTRHFNGTLNINKSNTDPLQFVKIHPNHDLIERAQEQLSLAESRKRLQEDYNLPTNSNGKKPNDEENDWSQAVDDWRHKREQKRLKNVNSNPVDNDRPISPVKIEPIPKCEEIKKIINEPVIPSPPIEKIKSKSPSPQRIKGPSKIREIFIEKPIDIRGFGFKLEDGRAHNRSIFISTIEEGSPADKAGLCIDDEVLSMNNDNIETMTFDQVRRILKERNLRGSIKLIVRTYEDLIDDNSQTVTIGHTTDHSRTPSPQKAIFTTTTKPNTTPSAITNAQSPVHTSLPYTPPPSTITKNIPAQQTSISVPKPFRSTTPGIQNNHESTTITTEKQPPPRIVVNAPQILVEHLPPPPLPLSSVESLLNENLSTVSNTKQQRDESPIAQVRSYVEKQMDQLQHDLAFGFSRAPKVPSSSSTPLLTTPAREQQRPVNIPVEIINYSLSPPPPQQDSLRSSLKKSTSTQNELDQIPSNRTYGVKIHPKEQIIHYLDPYGQQRPSSSHTKRSAPDLSTINRPTTTHSLEHTVNELKIHAAEPYSSQPQIITQQQKKVTIQLGGKIPPQRLSSKQLHATLNQAPRKTHFDDHTWINDDQRRQTNGKSNGHRSAPLAAHHQELQMNKQPIHNYHGQQRNFDVSPNKQHRTKSPVRTTVNTHNDRVLSVSGKLRCSRCNEELGQGSAMVIESLGLYYHIECFRCFVCNIPLSSSLEGIDVRVRTNRLHCQNCFSDENGVKLSAV